MSTGADRQRAYRVRSRFAKSRKQINTWVDVGAFFALERLARRYSVTRREMLEKLVTDADKQIVRALKAGSEAWDKYFGVTE